MASKTKPIPKDTGKGDGDVSGLVDSIRKHKKFKQLASYSIQCLEKLVCPPRIGWEINCRAAFELGAVEDIADVCAKFSNDAEVFIMCIRTLKAMAAIPKCLPALSARSTMTLLTDAVKGFFAACLADSSMMADGLSRLLVAFELLATLARHDAVNFNAAGGVALMLDISSSQADVAVPGALPHAGQIASIVFHAANALERVSRNKAGCDALSSREAIIKMVKGLSTNFQSPLKVSADQRKSARRVTMQPSSGGNSAKGTAAASTDRDLNAHMEPLLKALDRVCRTDTGRDAVAASGAIDQLQKALPIIQKHKTWQPILMRILMRVLGSNISELVARIVGERPRADPAADERDRVLCARVLASLCADREHAYQLVTQSEGELLRKLIAAFSSPAMANGDGAVSLCHVFASAADSSTECIEAIEAAGALPAALDILNRRSNDASLVEASAEFFAAMIDCNEMVDLMVEQGLPAAVSAAFGLHTSTGDDQSAAACLAALTFFERLLWYDFPAETLVGAGVIANTLNCMKRHDFHQELQLQATYVMSSIASAESHVRQMMTHGVLGVIIANLQQQVRSNALPSDTTSATAEDNDDDEPTLSAADTKATTELRASLTAATMFLLTSLCSLADFITAAKAGGIIKAVLTAFGRFSTDQVVYKQFREVIMALDIEEEEVLDALETVLSYTVQLQSLSDEQEQFKYINDYATRADQPLTPDAPVDRSTADANAFAIKTMESISLLEAVTVSPVYVAAIIASNGLPVLIRALGVFTFIKLVNKPAANASSATKRKPGTDSTAVYYNLADEVLSRTANTLAHIARVGYEIEAGQVEQDEDYVPLDFPSYHIYAKIHEKDVLNIIARAMLAGAKPQLKFFASSSVALMAALAAGFSPAAIRENVDALIHQQAIEACVGMLRAHQASLEVCSAVAVALGRIAVNAKGASAIATRGGSRQIIRMLTSLAAARTRPADELLLQFLKLIDAVAAGGQETADILKRQGLVDILVSCVDSGAESALLMAEEVDENGNRVQDASKAKEDKSGATATVAGAGLTGTVTAYTPDPVVRSQIDVTVSSTLSQLVSAEQIKEAVASLAKYAEALGAQVPPGGAYDPKAPLALQDRTLGDIARCIVRLGLFAATDAGSHANVETLESGVNACKDVADISLAITKAFGEASTDGFPGQATGSIEWELGVALPACIKCMRVLTTTILANKPSSTVATAAVPTFMRALEEKPTTTGDVVRATALISFNDTAMEALASAPNGIALITEAIRSGAEHDNHQQAKDALITLCGVSRLERHIPALISAGAAAVCQSYLFDIVNDADLDAVEPTLELLAQLSSSRSVINDLLPAGILDLTRQLLHKHCNDPSKPAESLVHSIAKLCLAVTHGDLLGDANRAEDYRQALRRLIKVVSSSTGYLNNTNMMVDVIKMIQMACTPSSIMPQAIADANKAVVVAAGAEDMIRYAMSSSAATDDVLDAGIEALNAIGATARTAALIEDIETFAARIPEWLDAGWTPSAPEVIKLISDMADCMRQLASCIVVRERSPLPDLGATYTDVLMTIWRAVAAVTRDDMETASFANGGCAALVEARASALAVGAQITGRLTAASTLAASRGEGDDGPHSVSLTDVGSVLYTILTAAKSAVQLRVVESLCKAVELVMDQPHDAGLSIIYSSRLSAGLPILMTIIHEALVAKRIAAKVAESSSLGGLTSQSDASLSTISTPDLQKCELAVMTTLKALLSKTKKSTELGPSFIHNDEQLGDAFQAAAMLSSVGNIASMSTDIGTVDLIATTDDKLEEPPTSDLMQLLSFVFSSPATAFGSHSIWNVLSLATDALGDAVVGPVAQASKGKAALEPTFTAQVSARILIGAVRYLSSLSTTRGLVPSQAALRAILGGLNTILDLSWDTARKGRSVAAKKLLPGKPESIFSPIPETTGDDFEIPSEAHAATVRATWTAVTNSASGAISDLVRLLSRLDCGIHAQDADEILANHKHAAGFAFLCIDSVSAHNGVNLCAVEALAALSDCNNTSLTPADATTRINRIAALGTSGAYKLAILGISTAVNNGDTVYVDKLLDMLVRLLSFPNVTIQHLNLDKISLLAIQAALRRFPAEGAITRNAATLVSALEAIYQEQSGAAFSNCSMEAVKAATAAKTAHRHVSADGKVYYSNNSATQWNPPPALDALVKSLMDVDHMTRVLEDEAVAPVPVDVVQGYSTLLEEQAQDVGIVGIALNAVGKIAANADNHGHIKACNLVPTMMKILKQDAMFSDPRVCEGLATLVLPLSFDPQYVKTVLSHPDVIPKLVAIIRKYTNHLTTYAGSDMAWVPDSHADYNASLAEINTNDAPDAEERNKRLPRLAQMCVQSLANLACDNEEDAQGRSSVTRIVDAQGVEALAALMACHPDNPRLLEDIICALSNMAFVNDAIQMQIGRLAMDAVCRACTAFNSDAYLFQMTLRAIGNLTRADENIMRAVGYGVTKAIVDGMGKHEGDPTVLQLCADVIGNMASVDDRKVPREEGIAILLECRGKSDAYKEPKKAAPPPVAGEKKAPPPAGSSGGEKKAPVPAKLPPKDDKIMAVLEACGSLKEAVCTILFQDGGAKALLTAMVRHNTNADLAGSSLRALHYIGASTDLVSRMVMDLNLVQQVILIMRSIDYRADVLRRGARVLGLVVNTEKLKHTVLEAGAPQVVLSAIETHKAERDLCISCYSVLAMARSPQVVAAVNEMQAIGTLTSILHKNVQDSEYTGVLLEVLWGWGSEAELSSAIATSAAPAVVAAFKYAAEQLGADAHATNLCLHLIASLARAGVSVQRLADSGLLGAIAHMLQVYTADRDPRVLLNGGVRSDVLLATTILEELLRTASNNPNITVSTANTEAGAILIGAGLGPVLERVLDCYKAIPDASAPDTLLYDEQMCKKVYGVLTDLVACEYKPIKALTVEFTDADMAELAASAPAITSPKGGAASSSGASSASKASVTAELASLTTGGKSLEAWLDGKPKKVRLILSADYKLGTLRSEETKKPEEIKVALVDVAVIRKGVPVGTKKKLLGRNPKADRCVTVEDTAKRVLLSLEVPSEGERDLLAAALGKAFKLEPMSS